VIAAGSSAAGSKPGRDSFYEELGRAYVERANANVKCARVAWL